MLLVNWRFQFLGTSNWSGDYFITTAGIGLIVEENSAEQGSLVHQLNEVFERGSILHFLLLNIHS